MLVFKEVLPGPFNAIVFEQELGQTLERMAGGILQDFYKTVETWNGDGQRNVEFEVERDFTYNRMEFHVFCDALKQGDRVRGTKRPNPAPPNLVYYFLNEGTDIRFAKMTPDFRPKSRVRTIGSFPGSGGVASVSVRSPQPGIVARKWDETIKAKYDKIVVSQARSALVRACRKSGHAYS